MTTRAEEIAAEGPYRADHENGFSVVRDLSAPEGSKIMMMMPEPMKWFADRMNEAHANGYKHGQQDRWIPVSEESKLPPIHEEPFAEDGFVLILLQCADWPSKYKTMKASRTIGDWDDDGAPLWFWTDEEGEIIDDDDNLITHWMPLPPNPEQP